LFRLQNNGLTVTTFSKLVSYLSADNCPILNLFLDWNPIYTDAFKPGDRFLGEQQQLFKHEEGSEEISLWAKL